MVRTIKDAYGITSKRSISIKEFCEYMDLPHDDIFNMINQPPMSLRGKSA